MHPRAGGLTCFVCVVLTVCQELCVTVSVSQMHPVRRNNTMHSELQLPPQAHGYHPHIPMILSEKHFLIVNEWGCVFIIRAAFFLLCVYYKAIESEDICKVDQ